jgi:hypothetical protein
VSVAATKKLFLHTSGEGAAEIMTLALRQTTVSGLLRISSAVPPPPAMGIGAVASSLTNCNGESQRYGQRSPSSASLGFLHASNTNLCSQVHGESTSS